MDDTKVYELSETRSEHAKKVINDVCKQSGEAFGLDPHWRSYFTESAGVKMELIQKAQVYASDDPNFFIMYIRDEGSGSGNPLKCTAIVSPGRDQRGAATSTFWAYIYLFLFSLPYLFSWGLRGLVDFLVTAHYEMIHDELYPEMADHLGVTMADTFQVEHLASTVGEFGKGYGSKLIKALHAKADEAKKHVILYSSSKRNVPFYLRHGYEYLREYDQDCTLMFRRYKI